jgi:hypothetical protein
MNKLTYALPIAGVALAVAIARPAVGQSADPTAQAILSQAATATQKAGSAHLHLVIAGASTGNSASQLNGTFDGDASWQASPAAHLTGTLGTSGALATYAGASIPVDITMTQRDLALKIGSLVSTCLRLPDAVAGTGATPGTTSRQATAAHNAPVLVGSETLGGASVWHIRETLSAPLRSTASGSGTIDLYITQSDSTVRRIAVSGNGSRGAASGNLTATADFSSYGEPVTVQTPASCAASTSPLHFGKRLLRPMRLFLHPVQLLRRLARAR